MANLEQGTTTVVSPERLDRAVKKDLNSSQLTPAQRQAIFDSWNFKILMVEHRHEVISFSQFFAYYNKTTSCKVATRDYRQIALMWRDDGVPVGVYPKRWSSHVVWGTGYFLALIDAHAMGFPVGFEQTGNLGDSQMESGIRAQVAAVDIGD